MCIRDSTETLHASRAAASHAARIGMLAPWAADDPVGRAARPPHTIRQAHNHPQRAAAHRAALLAKAAPHSHTNRAHSRAQHTAHAGARAAHTDPRAIPTRTRAQHARAARHRSAPHRAHFPSAAAAQHSTVHRHTTQPVIQPTPARAQHRRRTRDSNTHARTARARRRPAQRHTQSTLAHIISSSRPATAHISHTRAHTPHYRLAYCSRPREPQGPESRLGALRDPDPSRPQADSLKACKHQAD